MVKLKGSIKISGDKSISHRALIFASLSTGKVKISNLLESDDVMRTLNILKELGIKIVKKKTQWIVYGNGTGGYIQPSQVLDCGNSGTTSRLMMGAVSSNPINVLRACMKGLKSQNSPKLIAKLRGKDISEITKTKNSNTK